MNTFSHRTRSQNLERLATEPLDLLVIGGGVTGAGIAWDGALRGLRVGLVEKADFGSGTSGRSARLIHGGIRYLAQWQIGLVYESSRERRTLLRIAPHLVRPLPFLYPLYKGGKDRRIKIRAGMWMYDTLALFRNIHIHRMLDREETLEAEPCVAARRLLGAAEYYDAQVDDARLTLATAQAAHRAGALIANYTRAVGFLRDEAGQIGGITARDELTGETLDIVARVVVNATGVWADELMRLDESQAGRRLRPTKGIHIVVDRRRFGNRHAIVFTSPRDERMLFLVPWGPLAYIGTTETDYAGDLDRPHATAEDVAYLLEAANLAFPGVRLAEEDIISTWAGLRPLIADEEEENAYDLSREHEIFESDTGLISIAGGKLTTYRHMAEEVVDRVVARLAARYGVGGFRECSTDETPLDPAPLSELRRLVEEGRGEAASAGVEPEMMRHLIGRFGSGYRAVVRLIAEDPSLGEPIVGGLPYLWAEVEYALAEEMAVTLSDMLVRRIPLLYAAPDQGLSVARAVAERMAAVLSWDEAGIARQLAAYAQEAALTRAYR
ncbi:MAG: glycerol-3-phosphate dehydrogenase/oxidase [Anaerolineae bacterium]|nr:glycerol-3-phosphate dehydrogenase/oxidase [Anaerolineae bacterium]